MEEEVRGLPPSEVRRLKQLEEESRRLKQMMADLSLGRHMLQEVLRKNSEANADEGSGALAGRSGWGECPVGLSGGPAASVNLAL